MIIITILIVIYFLSHSIAGQGLFETTQTWTWQILIFKGNFSICYYNIWKFKISIFQKCQFWRPTVTYVGSRLVLNEKRAEIYFLKKIKWAKIFFPKIWPRYPVNWNWNECTCFWYIKTKNTSEKKNIKYARKRSSKNPDWEIPGNPVKIFSFVSSFLLIS